MNSGTKSSYITLLITLNACAHRPGTPEAALKIKKEAINTIYKLASEMENSGDNDDGNKAKEASGTPRTNHLTFSSSERSKAGQGDTAAMMENRQN